MFEVSLDGDGDGGGGGDGKGYTDVTVREAVEWTMSRDSEFTYIDVRSAEEHEKLATVRYCVAPSRPVLYGTVSVHSSGQ